MAVNSEDFEKRVFPRTPARVAATYCVDGSPRRGIAVTIDLSATGVKLFCKEPIEQDAAIQIEIKPGKNRSIPPFSADGRVVRCEPAQSGGYYVSCRLLRVNQ
jgi:hypothetical protein